MTVPFTQGVHHVGITVSRLETSVSFFTSVLDWKEARRDEEYPAIFVSDGSIMATLWQAREEPSTPLDQNRNVGLQRVVFMVGIDSDLDQLYERLRANQVTIEFPPESLRQGSARHMMCHEPSGIRVEFIWSGVDL
jgi:catechol 2,3-dioxygenase-like lactoylglutathione lyase family enzyme